MSSQPVCPQAFNVTRAIHCHENYDISSNKHTKCLLFISTFSIYWGNRDENDMVPSS